MDNENSVEGMFEGTEISELCDSIKNNHQILKAVGDFFQELGLNKEIDGNGLLVDFKKWGIRTIASQVVEKQFRLIGRLAEIYQEEQNRLK